MFWGVIDSKTLKSYSENIIGVRKAIPEMLKLFRKFDIKVTWGVVSSILCKNYIEWENLISQNSKSNSYKFFKQKNIINLLKNNHEYFFANDLVMLINEELNQEIGSHTFSHFNSLSDNCLTNFELDMEINNQIMSRFNLKNKSFIFPRNKINSSFFPKLKELGFNSFRGNPDSFLYENGDNVNFSYLGKALRYLDTYLGFANTYNYKTSTYVEEILNVPATFYLRPVKKYHDDNFEIIKLNSINRKLEFCAKNNLNFHLWWHPHNYGTNLDQNLIFLEKILITFESLKTKYNMQSKTMNDFTLK